MIRTTIKELDKAYWRAYNAIDLNDRLTAKIGEKMRERYGLHHRYSWIEFPDDRDYTVFMLRFG